jgi:hypothetical protein
MLVRDFLRRSCRPENQISVNTVTILKLKADRRLRLSHQKNKNTGARKQVMSFDNVGFYTLSPAGNPGGGDVQQHGVTYGGDDHGAQYVGAHCIFDPNDQVLVDSQIVVKNDTGFSYYATFHNQTGSTASFTLTGGGFA